MPLEFAFTPMTAMLAAVVTQAFYILFANQIDNPMWPDKICQNGGVGPQGGECVSPKTYAGGIVIASPMNITSGHIAKVKSAIPGAAVLAYFDFGETPIKPEASDAGVCACCTGHVMGDREGRNCSTTYPCSDGHSPAYLQSLNAHFPPSYAARKPSADGGPPALRCSYPGLAQYVWSNRSAPAIGAWLGGWATQHGFDGVYLDGYLARAPSYAPGWDYDGDGVAESTADAIAQYESWAPVFVAELRKALGDDAIILANAAGPDSDPNLNGLTIEMEACTAASGGLSKCTDALLGQKAATELAGRDPVSLMWLTHSEQMPAAQQCAAVAGIVREYGDWIQAGTDFFDGSHVQCKWSALG